MRRMTLALMAVTQSRIAAFNSASEKNRRWRSFASTKRWTIWTATSTFALERVVDCRSCGYDPPQGADHSPVSSAERSCVRGDLPAPSLGRGPGSLRERRRAALHDRKRVHRYRPDG